MKNTLKSYERLQFAELALEAPTDKLCWKLPSEDLSKRICVYIGPENQSFFNLTLAIRGKASLPSLFSQYNHARFFAAGEWIVHEPQVDKQFKTITSPLATNWMRRRYYFVEKCKDAQSLGIVIGTLTAVGYLEVVDHIQRLARQRDIRTYLLSVGKVNPAKLANFMEIDCFVFVGCPENSIYTSRDFYKPLLSVFEVELALNPAWHAQYPDFYCADFKEILLNGQYYRDSADGGDLDEYDVSLISGKPRRIRANGEALAKNAGISGAVEKKANELVESTATFHDRSWNGLDPSLGQHEPAKIVKGRSGIPIEYTE